MRSDPPRRPHRVRREIESDNKLDKSCNHLHEIGAQTRPAVRAVVHASLISSLLACLLVHRHRFKQQRISGTKAERTEAPLHPQSLARAMGSAAMSLANALELEREAAQSKWQHLAEYPDLINPLRKLNLVPPDQTGVYRVTSKAGGLHQTPTTAATAWPTAAGSSVPADA